MIRFFWETSNHRKRTGRTPRRTSILANLHPVRRNPSTCRFNCRRMSSQASMTSFWTCPMDRLNWKTKPSTESFSPMEITSRTRQIATTSSVNSPSIKKHFFWNCILIALISCHRNKMTSTSFWSKETKQNKKTKNKWKFPGGEKPSLHKKLCPKIARHVYTCVYSRALWYVVQNSVHTSHIMASSRKRDYTHTLLFFSMANTHIAIELLLEGATSSSSLCTIHTFNAKATTRLYIVVAIHKSR